MKKLLARFKATVLSSCLIPYNLYGVKSNYESNDFYHQPNYKDIIFYFFD
jgi:hypothetical protein